MRPRIDNLVVTLGVGDETHVIVIGDFLDFLIASRHDGLLLWRDDDIVKVEGEACHVRHVVTQVLDSVQELTSPSHTHGLDYVSDDTTQRLLGNDVIEIAHLLRDNLVDDNTSHGSLHHTGLQHAIYQIFHHHFHQGVQFALTFIVSDKSLLWSIECQALTLHARTNLSNIIESEHHVLGRNGDRCAIGGIEDIVALEHQYLRLKDGLIAQGKMDCHLITIKVGVECGTCQGVQLNGFSLNQLRLESLNTQTVKCRGTVEQYRVTFHHVLQDIPYHRLAAVNNLLGALHRLHDTTLDKLADDKRLVKLSSHQLGQTALTHLQLWAHYDHGTSGIVYTLTQQVLAETALFSLQGV